MKKTARVNGLFIFFLLICSLTRFRKTAFSESVHWMRIIGASDSRRFVVSTWGYEWILSRISPYFYNKKFLIIQPIDESDGGLIFFKLQDK